MLIDLTLYGADLGLARMFPPTLVAAQPCLSKLGVLAWHVVLAAECYPSRPKPSRSIIASSC